MLLIMFLGCCPVCLCAVLLVFEISMLPPSSGSKCVGGDIAVYI
jgi:hypothetical protein